MDYTNVTFESVKFVFIIIKSFCTHSYEQFGLLYHEALNSTVLGNDTYTLFYTFGSAALYSKWQQCCHEAIICCANYHKHYQGLVKAVPLGSNGFAEHEQQATGGEGQVGGSSTLPKWWMVANESAPVELCPPTWDGWLCWDEFARPNQVLEQSCPKHIYWHQLVPPCRGKHKQTKSVKEHINLHYYFRFINSLGYVTKLCNPSGQWFQNQEHKEWSNYTMCARDDVSAC